MNNFSSMSIFNVKSFEIVDEKSKTEGFHWVRIVFVFDDGSTWNLSVHDRTSADILAGLTKEAA